MRDLTSSCLSFCTVSSSSSSCLPPLRALPAPLSLNYSTSCSKFSWTSCSSLSRMVTLFFKSPIISFCSLIISGSHAYSFLWRSSTYFSRSSLISLAWRTSYLYLSSPILRSSRSLSIWSFSMTSSALIFCRRETSPSRSCTFLLICALRTVSYPLFSLS